jgi:myo-inositol-1(or 4)-monophosphatase
VRPDPDLYLAYRAFAARVAGEAAELARSYFGQVAGEIKPDDPTQVLTAADLAIGRSVVESIRVTYPDHNVVDEEAGVVDRGAAWTWVVDPIDGTSNFAVGIPLYAILVGLLHEGQPVVGAMVLPASGDVYTASAGGGADKNGRPLPLVDDLTPLERRLLCYGLDGDRRSPSTTRAEAALIADFALACVNLRTTGSAVDVAMVIESRCGASMYGVAKVWDIVGPHVLATEVGCLATALDGRPLDYRDACRDPGRRYSWCVAPPTVHAALGAIIARHPGAVR